MTVYLLLFASKLAHAQHYLGYTADLDARLACHRNGHGARRLQVITERGIPWRLVRTWPGDRRQERALKKCKHAPRLCPICNSAAAHHKPPAKE